MYPRRNNLLRPHNSIEIPLSVEIAAKKRPS
jgi:hypothetical protein